MRAQISIAWDSEAMKMSAFIFDVDGTLAETEESHRHAFNATFAAAGLGWHWDQTVYGELLKVTWRRLPETWRPRSHRLGQVAD